MNNLVNSNDSPLNPGAIAWVKGVIKIKARAIKTNIMSRVTLMMLEASRLASRWSFSRYSENTGINATEKVQLRGVSQVDGPRGSAGRALPDSDPAREAFSVANKNILVKTRNTEHQARIGERSARLKNLVGSFAVKNPELVAHRNIILIDDVTTTGATLAEARKVLRAAQARKVIAFTIAH